MYLILRRGQYDIIRFQWYGESANGDSSRYSLFRILLRLLEITSSSTEDPIANITISKRIILLLGIVGGAGISAVDFRNVLVLLRTPSQLTTSLLQAVKMMVKQDISVIKASPSLFFNFAGVGSGFISNPTTFDYPREFQCFTWFRVESFHNDRDMDESVDDDSEQSVQHIVTLMNHNQIRNGFDVYVIKKRLYLSYSYGKSDPIEEKLECPELVRGVWYHIMIKHSKAPRLSFFSKDEFLVTVDHRKVFKRYYI